MFWMKSVVVAPMMIFVGVSGILHLLAGFTSQFAGAVELLTLMSCFVSSSILFISYS
jgi:hypothetical protein